MTLFGISNTSNLLARYAAADITPGAQRGRAMGLIVWGSTVGSILGPNLMAPAVSSAPGSASRPSAARSSSAWPATAWRRSSSQVFLRPDPLAIARRLEAPAPAPAAGAAARTLGAIARATRACRSRSRTLTTASS